MSISRTRNAQHKVHIPSNARGNQYLMARVTLSDEIMAKYANLIDDNAALPYEKFYQKLSTDFFEINDSLGIESSHFIANNKFIRVRFSPEKLISETKQQLLFLYNPEYHTSQSAIYEGDKKVKKLTLLFLANGIELRQNSAKFHEVVTKAIEKFIEQIELNRADIKIHDHQHITYDLFAKYKGIETTQVHKIRSMAKRYLAHEQHLPEDTQTMTYAIVDFPINHRVRSLIKPSEDASEKYNELYNLIADAFISSAKHYNLNNGAVIANNSVPIVRSGEDENVIARGELLMLQYNTKHTSCGYTCKWDSAKLVDTVQLIFVASEQNRTSHGYGKYVNQIENSLRAFSERLDLQTDKEQLLVKIHQHINYDA